MKKSFPRISHFPMPTGLFLVFSAPSHFSTFFRHELQHETSHSMWSAPVKHSSPRWRKKGLCLLLLPVFYIQRMPYHHPRKTLWSQLPVDLKSLFCTLFLPSQAPFIVLVQHFFPSCILFHLLVLKHKAFSQGVLVTLHTLSSSK